jgi:hypothetical protein
MFLDQDVDVSVGARQHAGTSLSETQLVAPRKWNRSDIGRLALSAAALTLGLDTYAMDHHLTQSADAQRREHGASLSAEQAPLPLSDFDRLAEKRARLFAMHDEGNKTIELKERLRMLTEEMEELESGVTSTQLDTLAQLLGNAKQRQSQLKDFEAEFGF